MYVGRARLIIKVDNPYTRFINPSQVYCTIVGTEIRAFVKAPDSVIIGH